MLSLLCGHPAVAGGGARPHRGGAAPERLLRRRRERTEAHARDRDRNLQVQGLLGKTGAEDDIGLAALPVPLERVARDARTEQQQVVEVRDPALGAAAADVVDALAGGALDLSDRRPVEGRGLAQGADHGAVQPLVTGAHQ